nr:putative ribonuclease H-like domain-containing protein [Tanacetum cinerariifolium]
MLLDDAAELRQLVQSAAGTRRRNIAKRRYALSFNANCKPIWLILGGNFNGDSSAPTRVIEGVVQPVAPTTAEQRLTRKNELKARGTLLMALPDKHQLKFNIHKDAKTLMEEIEKRFGGNKETKKVQKTLLKQQYENFTDFSFESLDQIHDRLQKLISQLEILGESLSQEDINLNLKIYEAEVKSSSSASASTQNIAFVSSQNTDSTNEPVSAVASVSAASANIPVFALPNVDTLSNAVIYSFFASQSNSPQLDNDDLKQIDADDLDEMDLKWQMAMLNECRSPKDTRRNGAAEPQRRNVPVETSTSNALVSQCDVVGSYDWSFQAEEEPINYALKTFTSSSSFSSDNEVVSCSKACTKAYVTLQSHYDKLTDDFQKSQFDVISYKTRLESVKARLLVYQKNETVFEEDIKLLKLEVQLRDNALVFLRQKLKKAIQERDDLKLKLEKYQSGDGYHAVPPPYTGTYMPPKPDLVFHNAPNVNETVHTAFNVELSPTTRDNDLSNTHRPSAPIIEDWVSDSEDDSEAEIPQIAPSFVQPTEQVKTPRPSAKTLETSIPTANHQTAIPKPKSNGNRRNRKACFVCKSLDHLIKDLLTKSKLVPITTARPVTAAVPKPLVTRPRQAKTFVTKPHLPSSRHINRSSSPKASTFPSKVTSAKAPMFNVVKGVKEKWEWKPKCPILDHGNPQHALKDKGVIDSGCSRHMTGNMSYLLDFEELNSGYVTFGGNPKGGKISGKGKIRIGKLDFDDVYFVKELKFNLLSVSQMCDKMNNVLFTDTECLVLSPEFKLPYENQVLLRVPRENNMYNVDLKNIVPSGDLTCLFAKATLDEFYETYPVTILNTLDPLGKFDGKVDEGFLFGYSVSSKAFRVFSSRTRIVQETLHINFLENKPNVAGNQSNPSAGVQEQFNVEKAGEGNVQQYVLFLVWSSGSNNPQNTDGDAAFETKKHDDKTKREAKGKSPVKSSTGYINLSAEFEDFSDNNLNEVNAADFLVPAVGQISTNSTTIFSAAGPSNDVVSPTHGKSLYVDTSQYPNDLNMPELEDITYSDDKKDVGAKADFTNLETTITVSPIPTTRVHKDHLVTQIIGDLSLATQRRSMTRVAKDQGGLSQINNDDFDTSYASFMGFMVYQMDVKSAFLYGTIEEEVYVCQPLGFEDPDYPDKVYKVVKTLYGLHQAPRAWYETLANYHGFQRGKIDQTLFIKRQKGDILHVQIYVDDIIFGSTNKDLCKAFEKLMKDKFQMSSIGELTFFLGLQVKQKQDRIFISQDKYVAEILRKFGLTDGKSASTPIDTEKPLLKDPGGEDVDVHTYRSMIGSLMYLTSSRPDIMFAVCACARFQVTPKASYLHAAKRIFRYLKGKPYLGVWYPKDPPFNLVAYSDSDYAGASLDGNFTTEGQTVTGKEISNPFMAGSLPKTMLLTFIHEICIYMSPFEFSCCSSMASAVICLSTGKKFNFSTYIFDSLVRNVDISTKFYMYPRFLQLMIRAQVGDLSSHTTKYSSPALTQKVFANMQRVGKGFSGVDTPLFEGIIVAQQVDEGAAEVNVDDVPAAGVADEGAAEVNVDVVPAAVDEPYIPSPTLPTQPPPPSQDLPSTSRDAEMSMDLLHTLLETCTTLTRRVKHLEQDKIAQALEITKLKQRVKKLERRNKLKLSKIKRLKKVGTAQRVDTSDDTVMDDIEESADVQGRQAESQAQIYQIDLEHADKVLNMQDEEIEPAELQEVAEVVTTAKLMTEVVTAASATITAAVPTLTTAAAPTLTTAPSAARRRNGVTPSNLHRSGIQRWGATSKYKLTSH